jgi:hypothetical protein
MCNRLLKFRLHLNQTVELNGRHTVCGLSCMVIGMLVVFVVTVVFVVHGDEYTYTSTSWRYGCDYAELPIGEIVPRGNFSYVLTSHVRSYNGFKLSCKVYNLNIVVRGIPISLPTITWDADISCGYSAEYPVGQMNIEELNNPAVSVSMRDLLDRHSNGTCEDEPVSAIRYNTSYANVGVNGTLTRYSQHNVCDMGRYNLTQGIGYSIGSMIEYDLNNSSLSALYQCTTSKLPWFVIVTNVLSGFGIVYTCVMVFLRCACMSNEDGLYVPIEEMAQLL